MNNIPWGNVFIVLVLGFAFCGLSWLISKKVKSADDFMFGTGKLGVAFGSASLLAFWITGNTVMAAPESAYNYGVIGAMAYGFLGGFAVVLFAPLAKRIHRVLPNSRTVGDYYSGRFDNKNYYLFLALSFFYTLMLLITQGVGGGNLLEQIFGIPYSFALVLTFVIVMIYAAMGGFNSVTGVAFIQVILIVLVVLVVPPVVYFKTGVSPVYEGMKNLDPEKLNIFNQGGLLFMFAGCIMGIGEVFMDNTFWQRAYAIRKDKVTSIFAISGIGWLFVPMAVGTLAFVALANGVTLDDLGGNINQLAPYVAKIYGGNFVGYLFLVCVWSALASTIAGCLSSLSSMFVNDVYMRVKPNATPKEMLKVARIVMLIVGVIALVASLPRIASMLSMLVFIGVVNAAYIFPITLGLFWKKLNVNAAFLSVICAIVIGYIAYFTVGSLQGCVVSAIVSLVVCLVGSWMKPANFDWELLKKAGR